MIEIKEAVERIKVIKANDHNTGTTVYEWWKLVDEETMQALFSLAESYLAIANEMPEKKKIENLHPFHILEVDVTNRTIDLCILATTKMMQEKEERIKSLESELKKWNKLPDDKNLNEAEEQAKQPSLAAKEIFISGLKHKVKHQEQEIARLKDIVDGITVEKVEKIVDEYYYNEYGGCHTKDEQIFQDKLSAIIVKQLRCEK